MRISLNHIDSRRASGKAFAAPKEDGDSGDNWVPTVYDPNEVADDLSLGQVLAQPIDLGISLGGPDDVGIALDGDSGNASDSEYSTILKQLIKSGGILSPFYDYDGTTRVILRINDDQAIGLAQVIESAFQLPESSIDLKALTECHAEEDVASLILQAKQQNFNSDGRLSREFLTSD